MARVDSLFVGAMIGRIRRPGPMVAIALVYLAAASGIMIWRGISVSPDYILLLCVPIALLSGHVLRFLRDWIPFVAIFLGYEGLRSIAPKLGIAPHLKDVVSVESTLFGGHIPSAVLQSTFTGGVGRALAYAGTVVYFCHFALPFAVGLVLWLSNRTQFLRYSTALIGMSFLGFVIFLLLPTAPPWYAENAGLISGVTKLIDTTLPSAVSPFYSHLNSDPVAAFPSLHAAYPFLAFLALRPVFPRGSSIAAVWTLLVAFSVVYLGEHWAIDVFGGWLFAGLCWLAMTRLLVPHVPALQQARPSLDVQEPLHGEGARAGAVA